MGSMAQLSLAGTRHLHLVFGSILSATAVSNLFSRTVRRIFVPRSQALPQIISSNRRGGSKGTERLKFSEPCLMRPSVLDPCFWLSAFSHHPHPLLQRLPGSFRSSLQGFWKKDAWGGMHIGTHGSRQHPAMLNMVGLLLCTLLTFLDKWMPCSFDGQAT